MTTTVSSTGITFNDGTTLSTASIVQGGFKNRIRNGAMQIDQRNTASSAVTSGTQVTAGSFVVGTRYTINSVGTTNFTLIGASASTVGVSFIATGVGTGTGTADVSPYSADGWIANAYSAGGAAGTFTTQQVTDAPAGFSKSLKATVTGTQAVGTNTYYTLQQFIEGQDLVGLSFGSASAQSIAVSFWVKCSVTGTYTVAIHNGALTRSYITSYTIASASTWQQVKLVIPGDTTGTWATDTTAGMSVSFVMSTGTTYNGSLNTWAANNALSNTAATNAWITTASATFQITGVQLEANTAATSFEYSWLPTELTRNQRYFENISSTESSSSIPAVSAWGTLYTTTAGRVFWKFSVPKRAAPTMSPVSGATSQGCSVIGVSQNLTGTISNVFIAATGTGMTWDYTSISSPGTIGMTVCVGNAATVTASAEFA